MGVSIVDTMNLEWQDVPDSWPGKVMGESLVRYKYFATAMPSVPAGQLVRYEAGHIEELHSHQEDEVFIIFEGGLVIGDDQLQPGNLAFISGGTSYSPRTLDGCTYLRLSLRVS